MMKKFLTNLLCCFIPVKSWRQNIREKNKLMERKLGKIYEFCLGLDAVFTSENWPKNVLGEEETLDKIIKEKLSIARFGDGEFNLLINKSISFQKSSIPLLRELRKILNVKKKGFLPCISSRNALIYNIGYNNCLNLIKTAYIEDKEMVYGNADVTRHLDEKLINKWKKVWNNRDVIFIYGKGGRFVFNDDLFGNIRSYEKIEGSAKNAFNNISEIMEQVENYSKNKLVLIALGPAATVLAYKLFEKGYQAIDIGHITSVIDQLQTGIKPEAIKKFDQKRKQF